MNAITLNAAQTSKLAQYLVDAIDFDATSMERLYAIKYGKPADTKKDLQAANKAARDNPHDEQLAMFRMAYLRYRSGCDVFDDLFKLPAHDA